MTRDFVFLRPLGLRLCETGVVSITGTEEAPSKTGISVADIAAGMYAYSGILTALFNREKTGEGTVLEVSMLEALGEWMGYPAYYSYYGGKEPKRTGARHATIYPYGPFQTGDQKNVFLAIQNEREWARFCEIVLRSPETAYDSRFDSNSNRVKHLDELKLVIHEQFEALTAEEVIERLDEAQIANARLNTLLEFVDHPQLKARNRWREVESEAGWIRALIPPVTMEGVEPVMNPIPRVGEHTEKILEELGITLPLKIESEE